MNFVTERAKQFLTIIEKTIRTDAYELPNVEYYDGREKPNHWENFKGRKWGGVDNWTWFRTIFEMPEKYEGKTVILYLTTSSDEWSNVVNPQFVVYVNGEITQAFDSNHKVLYLTECAVPGEKFEIVYEGYSGRDNAIMDFVPTLYAHNYDIQRFYYNFRTALTAAQMHEKDELCRIEIENYITSTLNMIDLRKIMSADYYKSVNKANEYIEAEFYDKFCGHSGPIVNCIGHTHIDVAWLWTVDQTRHKAVRSFSTALKLMERYPEFTFMSSQPQLYKFVKEDAPEIYEKIKERVKEGRWEVEGGMWLEADCNLISGESFIRQLLHGKRFIMEEFGKNSKILWLPDVFGYSASMPQMLNKSGIDSFVTSKISWNEYNAMPYETFIWQGIDGSEIFTQFILGAEYDAKLGDKDNHFSSYSGKICPNALAYSWEHYHQKNINNEILTTYGYGDGGGGVTEDMLETYRRIEKGIPGTPNARISSATDCIKRIKKNIIGKKIPKWVGELYLEYHRGTYTSMAKNKRYNRKSEFLLQNAETLSLIGKHLLGYEYPKQELYDSWEKLLLNQFHDILPGTAIKEVYDVTDKEYESLTAENTQLTDKLISSLADKVAKKGIFVYNPTGFERSDVVSFNDALIYVENIPAYGWRVIGEPEIKKSDMIISEHHIENRFFIIDIDDCGNLIRVYDRLNDREVIKKGERANVLRAYDDHPRAWDNWEITMYYKEQMWEVNDVISIEVTENEFTSGAVRIKKKFLDSTLVQKIRVYRDVARIDFENEIDWHENHILLKTEFPVDIHSEKATYEIQYGAIERPTHSNTSWDAAKFEVCGHKWADLSEAGYGAAILNDCKYGYDIHDGVMSLTLIKCGTHPNPEADKCMHRFTYSFMPHNGHWREADVVREAYYLNCPLKAIETTGKGTLPAEFSFISSDCENVIISAVKEACDNGDIIVRIYEAYGKRTKAVIKIGFEADSVFDINFIETENYSEIDLKVNEFELTFKPYEIKTIRIKL